MLDNEKFNERNAAQFENMRSSFDFWRIMYEGKHLGERIAILSTKLHKYNMSAYILIV